MYGVVVRRIHRRMKEKKMRITEIVLKLDDKAEEGKKEKRNG